MDQFTRRYLQIFGAVLVGVALSWLFSFDRPAARLNDRLAENATLSAYPYPFKVLAVDNRVATLSSPRSAQVSALVALRLLFPSLATADPQSEEIMDAQRELAKVQGLASQIVTDDEGIDRVVWELDTRWLEKQGVVLPPL
jgi:hypothetical protein